MYYLHNSRLINYSGQNRNRLMCFHLKVDYYSNEANKNKYKNVQLIASRKNNLKIATDCFVAWTFRVICCLGLLLPESIFIELESILLLESYVCFSKI